MRICEAHSLDKTLSKQLGGGEIEAISLAVEIQADLLLCDDDKARKAATQRKIHVTGTLGVIQMAAENGFVDLRLSIEKLKKTTFRISDEVVIAMLRRTISYDPSKSNDKR
jgi:predicted nucleic acid-binding protein